MRKLINILAVSTVAFLLAGSAQAITSQISFSNLTGLTSLSPGAVQTGNSLTGVEVGDTFEVSIFLDNSAGDAFQQLATFLVVDPTQLNLTQGFADLSAFPTEPGFGTGNSLTSLSAPAPAIGQPAGTFVGMSIVVSNLGTGDGFYSSPNSGVVAVAIFEAVGAGSMDINHVVQTTTIQGFDQGQGLGVGTPLSVTVVPEPGTALLMGLGLAGLTAAGRRSA